MNFLFKLEDILNRGLIWLGALLFKVWMKMCPAFLLRAHAKVRANAERVKELPAQLKARALELKAAPKDLLKVDYKGLLAQAVEAGKKVYEQHKQKSPIRAVFSALATPFGFIFNWAKALSPAHFMLLFTFSLGSVLSVLGIAINSHRILKQQEVARAPASVEADPYERPDYYKKETREVTFTNVKLPVFVTGITELRSLLVDFSVIAQNRATKQWLERHEFEVRDHLVLTVEPVLPQFPMTDEGRSILIEKLKHELNVFLAHNEVEGTVTEVRLTYVLAN